jgi:iron complex outermembrane receptor protein
MRTIRCGMASSLLAIATLCTLPNAAAVEAHARPVLMDLPAQPLAAALLAIGQATGRQIVFPGEAMATLSAPAIRGEYDASEAVRHVLAGTGFILEIRADAIYVRGPRAPAGTSESVRDDRHIVVTGSRIRGAATASPVYRFETGRARDEGITDMHALAAAIPQNFNGGQNPGVGNGAESFGSSNGDSSTALNLRGLGPDATLTLLNGHRLAYNQNNQAVDFSSIPLAAVERVEIMPDGASALYGSDAIGGVANIILKKNLRGAVASMTLGEATQGGYFTQNYSLVGGTGWNGGGIVVTGSFDRNSAIMARDRDFTQSANGDLTLYPATKAYAFVGSAHHTVMPTLALSLDAVYAHRNAARATPYTAAGPVEQAGVILSSASWNLSVAPVAVLSVSRWDLTLAGSYGRSHSANNSRRFPRGATSASFDNETASVDFSAEGPLVSLPAGDVRLAVGAGYRRDSLISRLPGSIVSGHQDNRFGYGELNVPLFSPEQEVAGFHRLSAMAAVRYEDYQSLSRLATPKLGLTWSPIEDADIRLSWGKSFKTPTLFQRFNPTTVLLYPGDLYGMRQAPAGQTILSLSGGRPDLEPERATSLSAGITLHPRAIRGLEISASYFHVNYRDRIVLPIRSLATVFTDSAFTQFVRLAPSLSEISNTIALSAIGLDDQTGRGTPFDPASVYAILDERYQNVSRDRIKGLDVTARYSFSLGASGTLALYANATYLRSQRVLIEGQDVVDLAGTIYNPPHVRARGGLGWSRDVFSINAVINHIGAVTDDRRTVADHIGAMTTFDMSLKRKFTLGPRTLEVQASALNLFNAKPDRVHVSGISAPYDFTNYPAIGRYLSVSLSVAL